MNNEDERERSKLILDECLALTSKNEDASKETRLDNLIAQFSEQKLSETDSVECAAGWHFCVRPSFRAAIDVKWTPRKVGKKTVMKWTQGSWFHFKEGDTIYDSPLAYLPWDLNNFNLCIEVTTATPAQPPNSSGREERDPGSVFFEVSIPNATRDQLVRVAVKKMTQDDFVRMLILGPPNDWKFSAPQADQSTPANAS